ncbi:MAG: HupE/UreJ family protein [Planctomycetota bacterium]
MVSFSTLALTGLCCVAAPHDPGLSSVRVVRTEAAVVVHAAFANADFRAATKCDRNGDGEIDAGELAASAALLRDVAVAGFRVQVGEGQQELLDVQATIAENRDVELTLRFAANEGEAVLEVPFLSQLSRGHRCYVAALGDGEVILADALLHGGMCSFAMPEVATAAPAGFGQGLRFFALGIEHILIGFDHLAFLLALLAAGVTFRRVLATITAFTVAHSVTLGAAAFGLVHLPGQLVESTIAASIVWVAVANLAQRGGRAPHRWPLALGFGLVHGFGFASVLADLHVGGPSMLVPLVTFNLGVEVGQLAFALVAVPLLATAMRSKTWRWLPTLVSVAVGLAGLWWFCERAF